VASVYQKQLLSSHAQVQLVAAAECYMVMLSVSIIFVGRVDAPSVVRQAEQD